VKQPQVRPKTRAPHGSPIYTKRCGGWVTEAQWKWLRKRGMSNTLRDLVAKAMEAG
jgi:hypothetical protein